MKPSIIYYPTFFAIFLYHLSVFSQQNKIDSLLTVLKTTKEDTNKVKTLNKLGLEYRNSNPDTSYIILKQTFALAEKINWLKGRAIALLNIGSYHYFKSDYPQALNYYSKALKIFQELEDKNRIATTLGNIGNVYSGQSDYPKALDYYSKALKMTEELGDKNGIVQHLTNIGLVYSDQADYHKALGYYLKALKIVEELGDKSRIAAVTGNIGIVYYRQAYYPKALGYYFKALKINEELGNKRGIASNLGSIGNVYFDQADYTRALNYYFKALKLNEELGNKSRIAGNLNNIANIYSNQDNFTRALNYYFKALKMSEEVGDEMEIINNLSNIGIVYNEQANYANALNYYFKALKMSEKIEDKNGIARHLVNIGELFIKTGKFAEAEKYMQRSLALFDSLGVLNEVKKTNQKLSKLYDTTGRYQLALKHYKKYIAARDSIASDENTKKQTRTEMTFEFDKKEATAKAQHEKQMAISEAEKKKQRVVIYSVSAGMLLLLLLAGVIFKALQSNRKKNKTITEQKHLVEEKNKEITDSITYAKRLQDAILPPKEFIDKYLPNNFVLYKPKDIVAGDFYWAEKIGNLFFMAAADSTGHGVPGAMVSVVCSNALNRTVKEFNLKDTGKILDKTRELVIETFEKSSSEVKDGMDISLLCIDKINKTIFWSGANNPLCYIEDSVSSSEVEIKEIKEIKPNKQPIGKTDYPKPFTTHQLEYKEGTTFYLFTDGFADQFGGPNGKKFKYKQFSDLLVSINSKPLNEQSEILSKTFEDWKVTLEQVDDVCVIGVKL